MILFIVGLEINTFATFVETRKSSLEKQSSQDLAKLEKWHKSVKIYEYNAYSSFRNLSLPPATRSMPFCNCSRPLTRWPLVGV